MAEVERIAGDGAVKDALASFADGLPGIIDLAIAIQQIPSPTFAEQQRAEYVAARFREIGLHDVQQDALPNVYGRLPGLSDRPPVVLSAHTDTVFATGTDLTVRHGRDGRQRLIYGPGLADNAVGVAGLITVAATLARFGLRTDADLWFVANAAEEGLGDLRGMRAVADRFGPAATYIVVEGGSFGQIYHQAVGVRRFRIEVKTGGGHSWGDFGAPSAVHALCGLVARLSALPVKEDPKTTYNVGVIAGGTVVNAIAGEAHCLLDLRSVDDRTLEELAAEVDRLVRESRGPGVTATMHQIGARPAGCLAPDSPPVVWAAEALRQVGSPQIAFIAGSTDANVPLGRGWPAVCIGLATSGNTHRLDEYLNPERLPQGLGQLLLLALAAGGFPAAAPQAGG